MVIILSGDIANSGRQSEYNTAYKFLSNLKSQIKRKIDSIDIKGVIVPGNHDVDYSKGMMQHSEMQEIFKQGMQDTHIASEIKKMNAFYNHAKGLNCFSDKTSLICIKEFSFGDTKI